MGNRPSRNTPLLVVAEGATQEEIKKEYRRMALKVHPDKNGGSEESKENFQQLSQEYELLISKPDKKMPEADKKRPPASVSPVDPSPKKNISENAPQEVTEKVLRPSFIIKLDPGVTGQELTGAIFKFVSNNSFTTKAGEVQPFVTAEGKNLGKIESRGLVERMITRLVKKLPPNKNNDDHLKSSSSLESSSTLLRIKS